MNMELMMLALTSQQGSFDLHHNVTAPSPRQNEVLVDIHYASLNPTDLDMHRGTYDLFLRLSGISTRGPVRTGLEFSGIVREDHPDFQKGDRVFGYTHLLKGPKTHQSVLAVPADMMAALPADIDMALAAGLPIGAQTSLIALRDVASLSAGQRLLINGASGGVGLYTIQFAKAQGLHITTVASAQNAPLMRQLGADITIDYRHQDILATDDQFDAIIDYATNLTFGAVRHLLTHKGIFIPADPFKNMLDFFGNIFRRQKTGYLYVDRGQRRLLTSIATMVQDGELQMPDSQIFPIADYQSAIEQLETPGTIGRIIFDMRTNG